MSAGNSDQKVYVYVFFFPVCGCSRRASEVPRRRLWRQWVIGELPPNQFLYAILKGNLALFHRGGTPRRRKNLGHSDLDSFARTKVQIWTSLVFWVKWPEFRRKRYLYEPHPNRYGPSSSLSNRKNGWRQMVRNLPIAKMMFKTLTPCSKEARLWPAWKFSSASHLMSNFPIEASLFVHGIQAVQGSFKVTKIRIK